MWGYCDLAKAAVISGVRGMGGLGKTELAYAAAVQLRDDYPGGQILLELTESSATPRSLAQALQQVIRAFRSKEKLPEELPAPPAHYCSALNGRRVLMFADDMHNAAQVRLLFPLGCWRKILWTRLQSSGCTTIDFVGTLGESSCGGGYDGNNEGHGGFQATLIAEQNQLPGWLAATNPDIVVSST